MSQAGFVTYPAQLPAEPVAPVSFSTSNGELQPPKPVTLSSLEEISKFAQTSNYDLPPPSVSISLFSQKLTPEGISALADGIRVLQNLTSLDLGRCCP